MRRSVYVDSDTDIRCGDKSLDECPTLPATRDGALESSHETRRRNGLLSPLRTSSDPIE